MLSKNSESCHLAPKRLFHELATLVPLAEEHRAGLSEAGSSPEIWLLQPFNIAEGFDAYFDWLLAEQAAERWMPFAVLNPAGKIIGQTCYLDIRIEDRGVEIGGTWYAPEVQGTMINPAAKMLLLEYAFACGMVRVQFKTDVRNARSRAAIAKLGAIYEGALRKHKMRPDGSWRDTVYYSITDEEWILVQENLRRRLQSRGV